MLFAWSPVISYMFAYLEILEFSIFREIIVVSSQAKRGDLLFTSYSVARAPRVFVTESSSKPGECTNCRKPRELGWRWTSGLRCVAEFHL